MKQLLQDPAVRFGLKLSIAGLLALYFALLLRVHEPTWALFTVFVLMISPYVGSIMEKTLLRILGTIAGVALGYLVLSLEQNPLVLLILIGIITTFCVAMLGQSLWPYGFFLCALTMIDVLSPGLRNPDMAWQYSLARAEAVLLGIVVVLVVQSIFWPRFAGEEFKRQTQAALRELQECFQESAAAMLAGGNPVLLDRVRALPARVSKLRALINFGVRESLHFKNRVPLYYQLADSINRIATSIIAISKPLEPSLSRKDEIHAWIQSLCLAVNNAFLSLITNPTDTAKRAKDLEQMQGAFRTFEKHLEELRQAGVFQMQDTAANMSLGHHFLALDEIRCELARIHEELLSLEKPPVKAHRENWGGPFKPTKFWVHLGLKGAIAVTTALVLENWLHPPGGTMLPISTWILVVRGPTAPAGKGDWRVFRGGMIAILAWWLLGLILLATHPMLASYAVMNVTLFALLFLWGYLFYGKSPMTISMLVGMLMIVGLVGLNAQEPVTFQDIVDLIVGATLAVALSSIIRRLFWPSLPQWELRNRLVELVRLCRKVVDDGGDALPLWQRTRIALIPTEAATRLNLLSKPIISREERDAVGAYLRLLHLTTSELMVAAGRLTALLPGKPIQPESARVATLKKKFHEQLAAHENLLLQATPLPSALLDEFRKEMLSWNVWVDKFSRDTASHIPVHQWLCLLGLCRRFEESGENLILAGESSTQFRWEDCMRDTSL